MPDPRSIRTRRFTLRHLPFNNARTAGYSFSVAWGDWHGDSPDDDWTGVAMRWNGPADGSHPGYPSSHGHPAFVMVHQDLGRAILTGLYATMPEGVDVAELRLALDALDAQEGKKK
jgi:hypothetical protein